MSRKSRRQRARERPCRVYFGSHGCKKQRGHGGYHVCDCGFVPSSTGRFFGEDVETMSPQPVTSYELKEQMA